MEKKRTWRNVMLWILVIFAILYCLPTLVGQQNLPDWYAGGGKTSKKNQDKGIFKKKLNFGLDLQGGLALRYKVDWQEAIRQSGRQTAESIRLEIVKQLAEKDNKNSEDLDKAERTSYGKNVTIIDDADVDYNEVVIQFSSPEMAKRITNDFITEQIDERYEYLEIEGGAKPKYKLRLPDQEAHKIRDQVVAETKDTIGRRIEAFGLVDPDVRSAGDDYIMVQIPGVGKDQMDTVRSRIGQTAQLTLRIVDTANTWLAQQEDKLREYRKNFPERALDIKLIKVTGEESQAVRDRTAWIGPYVRSSKKSELLYFVSTLKAPAERMFGFEKVEIRNRKNVLTDSFWRTQLLEAKAGITGEHLKRAQVAYDEKGAYVSLDFTAEGGRVFADLTEANVQGYMAIMLDEVINSSPQIQEKIGGGRARITMGGGNQRQVLNESQGLVKVLTHGAYKAPVYKVQDNEVGPSLGADSVAAGEFSMGLGMLLVVIFMALYYRKSGLIAVVVLVLNMLFILTLLISMNSALTLPGMAGIILTIGMAVDANIIIFERIREEINAGKKPRAAVDAGYEKAFSTILDANVTTALAGFILLNITSGPIRGFAVTLLLGIVCSVFTAVYVSRRIFNWWLDSKRPETLSI